MLIEKGTLWRRVSAVTDHALAVNALVPIATNETFIEENGIRYFVRVLEALKRKDEARKEQAAVAQAGARPNPFLPPEPDLTVGEVSPDHVAVLNKFNVVRHHLLIVTRRFEDQTMLLTAGDFEALRVCMAEYESLGFYNGGAEAGASQQHKHLQMVPLPLASDGRRVPIEPLLPAPPVLVPSVIPAFPFLHAFARLDPAQGSERGASVTNYRLYAALLEKVGIGPPSGPAPKRQTMPYCLLLTREWMLIVPRTREHFEDISLNSLAFAGSFFVRDKRQLERLRSYGPLSALKAVSVGAERSGARGGSESRE